MFVVFNLIGVIIILIGLIGGISSILTFVTPSIVQIVYLIVTQYNTHRRQQQQPNLSLCIRIKFLCQHTMVKLKNVNFFSNSRKANEDERSVRIQRLSTEIYIILLGLALIILTFYSSLNYTTQIFEENISTVNDYVKLRNAYNNRNSVSKFECPCQTLSITRSSYIRLLEPQFHEVCSSNIVDNQWIDLLVKYFMARNLSEIDVRKSEVYTVQGTAFAKYQVLARICNMVKEAVDIARTLFLNSILITSQIADQNQFKQETMATIEQFQQTLPNNFIRMLKLIRGLHQANGIVSSYSSNWYTESVSGLTDETVIIHYDSRWYGDCNCATETTCHLQIDDSIPGYMVGCLPLESMLHSTLECHYNLSCIEYLFSLINGECRFQY